MRMEMDRLNERNAYVINKLMRLHKVLQEGIVKESMTDYSSAKNKDIHQTRMQRLYSSLLEVSDMINNFRIEWKCMGEQRIINSIEKMITREKKSCDEIDQCSINVAHYKGIIVIHEFVRDILLQYYNSNTMHEVAV